MSHHTLLVLISILPTLAGGDDATFEGLVASRGAEPLFWFAPREWTSWDRRVSDLGVTTFFPGADLVGTLLEPVPAQEDDDVTGTAGVPRKQRHRLAGAPGAVAPRRPAVVRPRRGAMVRLLAPRVQVRVTPHLAGIGDVAAPAPARPVLRPTR